MTFRLCLSFLCALSSALIPLHESQSASPQPNVIVIFIDDMGYGDVGFNGATIPKTPNLDTMAAEGMIFDDFYVGCAVCSGLAYCTLDWNSLPTSFHEPCSLPTQ